MNFNLHFDELHSDNFINDKNNLFENYIPKCYKVKRILISFNCFSEYIFVKFSMIWINNVYVLIVVFFKLSILNMFIN